MSQLARQARAASRELARLTTGEKNSCLLAMADAVEQHRSAIQEANTRDMTAGVQSGLSSPMLDRLKLDEKRIAAMAKGLREVAALPDPVGRILDERLRQRQGVHHPAPGLGRVAEQRDVEGVTRRAGHVVLR